MALLILKCRTEYSPGAANNTNTSQDLILQRLFAYL